MNARGYTGPVQVAGATHQTQYYPIGTYSLVAMNLILFFFGAQLGDVTDLASRFGLTPAKFDFWALLTSIFLHFQPAHLMTNMLFLWLFGRKLERDVGPIQFLLFYIGSGFAASLLHMAIVFAFLPTNLANVPVVGASGAISGVLGMYAIRYRNDSISVPYPSVSGGGHASQQHQIVIAHFQLPSVILFLVWLSLQAVLGLAGILVPYVVGRPSGPFDLHGVGYWSHIGGFVFGMAAAWATSTHGSGEAKAGNDKQVDDLRKRTLAEIAERYNTLATAYPDDPFAHAELGRVRALLGDQAGSTAGYLKAIELYRDAGRRDEALCSVHEALRYWPETTLVPDVLFRLACHFESLGEYQQAANRFAWLAKVAEGSPEAEMSLLKLGQVQLDKLNHPARAAEALERLLSEHPKSRWADLARQILVRAREQVMRESGASNG